MRKIYTPLLILGFSTIIALCLALLLDQGFSLFDEYQAQRNQNQINMDSNTELETLGLFNKILYVSGLEKRNYSLHFIDIDDELTAIAGMKPGRELILKRGFIDLFDSEQGKAFVLAHELGHSELGHTSRLIDRLFTTSMEAKKIKLETNPFFIAELSQKKELEADTYAIKLLETLYGSSNLNLDQITEMFEILAILENKIILEDGSTLTREEWQRLKDTNSSHPTDLERIQAIKILLSREE